MKKYLFLLALAFASCNSVKNHNDHLNDLISVQKLINDVDFAQSKLQKMHPKLYWYISQDKLDYKFDSLKKSIDKPMTTMAFYKKLSPVIAAVRQGHLFVYPSVKQYTKKESKSFKKAGVNPISQFDFELFDNKLIVVRNKSIDKSIKIGSEVTAINDKKPLDLINEYRSCFASDGFNTTFKNNFSGRRFSTLYGYEKGIKDGLTYQFKINDSSKTIIIKRKNVDKTKSANKKVVVFTDLQKDSIKAVQKKLKIAKKVNGYDQDAKNYSRNLNFKFTDSSVAVMKINRFKIGDYKTFYKQSFEKIQQKKCKTLIIDLRNNPGGRLAEINELYAYLADSTFVFLDKSEVTSKNSLFKYAYLQGGSPLVKTAKIIAIPLVYPVFCLLTKKGNNGKYYENLYNKPQAIKNTAFKGKIFVLINGGSFSASSIISSNLKGSKRAIFVGQETGGAFNGTVAGYMPIVKLPSSKIKIRIGLISCEPHFKSIDGRGIFPDKEIIPTINDRISAKDVEMDWILEQIL